MRPLSRRQFLQCSVQALLGTSTLGITGYGYDYLREPAHVHIAPVRVEIKDLPPAFDGYQIINLTDIHLGPSIAYHSVMRAISLTEKMAPDLIVLTGDFVTKSVDEPALRAALSRLSAPDGVWAVMGNHDYWVDISRVRHILADCGVVELRNASTQIRRARQSIWLAGVDDIWERQHDLDTALHGIPDGAPTILLAHEPDYADEVAPTGRVSLQLSGHSHGGQIATPLLVHPMLSDVLYLGRKYPRGLYQIGEMALYTSAGLGRGPIPRLFADPELSLITLRPAPA